MTRTFSYHSFWLYTGFTCGTLSGMDEHCPIYSIHLYTSGHQTVTICPYLYLCGGSKGHWWYETGVYMAINRTLRDLTVLTSINHLFLWKKDILKLVHRPYTPDKCNAKKHTWVGGLWLKTGAAAWYCVPTVVWVTSPCCEFEGLG